MSQPSVGYSHPIPVIHLSHHHQQQHQQTHTVVPIAVGPPHPPMPPPPPNLPCTDLVEGNREEYIMVGVPLYEAALKGDWKTAKRILDEKPDLIHFAITGNYETLLHVVASAESTKAVEEFVLNLVNMMDKNDLKLQNKNYDTALSLAAAVGNVKTAKIMVNKNPALPEIPSRHETMPLYLAALFAKPEMVRYLYGISKKMSGDYWSNDNRGWVLHKCVEAEIFDVALNIVNDCPRLTIKKGLVTDVLLALAHKPHAFKQKKPHIIFRIINSVFAVPDKKESEAVQLLRIIWKNVAKLPKGEIDDILRGPPVTITLKDGKRMRGYHSRVLFVATKMGNTRFIVELIRLYPDLIWKKDDKGKTIFHLAIKCRQAKIYNLLYEIGAMKEIITPITDRKGNNMLHMAAYKANRRKIHNGSGVAFEIQRELLWFKEVEQMIPPTYRQRKNEAGETPQDMFARKQADLVSNGKDWLNHYMLVATLIATIVFAAAFTLPGGYNQNTSVPFFQQEPSLIIFVISDSVSLISSSTSVLIFLSIHTSRYAERNFMKSLPRKLMFGLATLFLSIATMMVAFSASFFVLYNKKMEWVPITITCMGALPVILFAIMQFHLLVDVFQFSYRSRYLFRPRKRILYC